MRRKIAVVTGTRAEYGILHPVLKRIQAGPGLRLLLVVTGMHLSHEFGYTVGEIEKDGFKVDARVDMSLSGDTLGSMAKTVGLGIIGMSQTWEQLKPDMIMVFGDRVEPLAATIAGAYMNIPVAHIQGGDTAAGGTIDDSNRHAITKFAHLHFTALPSHAGRVIKLGEDPWRVHVVGSPSLDVILNQTLLPPEILSDKLGIDLSHPLLLVVQHPITTQSDEAAQQMRKTLEAVVEMGYPAVIIYPNSDAGGRRMIAVIREFEKHPFIKTFKSLSHIEFLSLMKVASVMLGNSSGGMMEAPSFGLPAINIGIRQQGRERGYNVIDVAHDRQEIMKAVEKALADKAFREEVQKCWNPYGDGKASERIVKVLNEVEITPELLRKRITY